MTIINASPDNIIQLGYEGEDRVTVLRVRYGEDWLENGDGIFKVRFLRNGENQAYYSQMVLDDRENHCLLVTLTAVELSKKGTNEMQVVYSGEDFIKKSPVYRYYVSRSVDEAVDPPAQDVYTQIIESLSDLQTDVQGLADAVEDIGDISLLTTMAKTDLVSAINEVNAKDGSTVTVDDTLSATSTNPVQNKVVTSAVQSKADIQTVSALSDAVNGLDSDVQGLQTTVQAKADTATVTALSGTVSGLQTTVQSKADASTVTALTNRVTSVETDKASHDEVDTVQDNLNLLGQIAQQYMEQTSVTLSGLQTTKADKSYVDTRLASKVDDVQINGASIVSGGVANVPVAGSNIVGVVKTEASQGLVVNNSGLLTISQASQNYIKSGTRNNNPITPIRQHESAFYGLAKIAGHDEKNSTLPVGTYSEEAKIAIQKMLGIYEAPWELINEETFTNESEADYIITTDANGDAFELTDLVIMFETPKQAVRAVKGYYGHIWCYYGNGDSQYMSLECSAWEQNANEAYHTCGGMIENKGGLMVSTIIASSTGGTRTPVSQRLITGFPIEPPMSFIRSSLTFTKINIKAVTGTGHYRLYGKRKWQ